MDLRQMALMFVVGFGLPSVGAAEAPKLVLPIDCTLGETCFIQQFVDHDPGTGSVDFACGTATYDGHKGTDIRLPSSAQMRRGVTVLAAAAGVVQGVRDGMADDRRLAKTAPERIQGRECGNGVVLAHKDGWRTQYCHMKRGSILVKKGQRVAQGAPLGQVGLSGKTQFAHVHITVNKDKQIIDPFQPEKVNKCGALQGGTLWAAPIADNFTYQPTQVIQVGFAPEAANYDKVMDGEYVDNTVLSRDLPLVAFGLVINLRKGDTVQVSLFGPKGMVAENKVKPFAKNKAQWMGYTGKKAPATGWSVGDYMARVQINRAGRIISQKEKIISLK